VNTQKAVEWKRNLWGKLSLKAVEDYLMLNRIKPESKEEVNETFAEHGELLRELGYYGVRVSDLVCSDKSYLFTSLVVSFAPSDSEPFPNEKSTNPVCPRSFLRLKRK